MPDPRPIGRPKPEEPQPCAVKTVVIPVPAGDTNLLDPAVIAEEIEEGEKENEKQ